MSWQTIQTWHVVGVGPMIIQQHGLETRHSINGSPWEHHSPEAPSEPVEVILRDVPEPIEVMDVLPLHFNPSPKRKRPRQKIPDGSETLDRKQVLRVLEYLSGHPEKSVQSISTALQIPEGTVQDIMAYLTYHGYTLRRSLGFGVVVFEAIYAAQSV